MIRFISLLVSIPVIILIAAFTYKNAHLVPIDLFLYQINLPMAVWLLIALLIGVVVGYLINIMSVIKLRNKVFRLQSKQQTLEGLSGVLHKKEK